MKQGCVEIVVRFLVASVQGHFPAFYVTYEGLLEESLNVAVLDTQAVEEVSPEVSVAVYVSSPVSNIYNKRVPKIPVDQI